MFPTKPWSEMHVWIGGMFWGGMFLSMFRGMFRVMFRSAVLLTKGTLWGYVSGYVSRYVSRHVSGYVSEGSNMRPFMTFLTHHFRKQPNRNGYSPP